MSYKRPAATFLIAGVRCRLGWFYPGSYKRDIVHYKSAIVRAPESLQTEKIRR